MLIRDEFSQGQHEQLGAGVDGAQEEKATRAGDVLRAAHLPPTSVPILGRAHHV